MFFFFFPLPRLYLICRTPRPTLKEHLLTRVNAVNFNVGLEVIESQLLSYLIRHEQSLTQQPNKENKDKGARDRESEERGTVRDKEQEYQEYHDQLLSALAASEGDVLDNETLATMVMQTRNHMLAIKANSTVVLEEQKKQGTP